MYNLQSVAQNQKQMSDIITVNISASERSFPTEGIVPVVFEIKNEMPYEISVLLPYPNPNNLQFSSAHLKIKELKREIVERSAPVYIAAGDAYRVTYFLNRYFFLNREGTFEIGYKLNTTIVSPDMAADGYHFEGNYTIHLHKASSDELKKQYAFYSEQLTSPDQQTRMEAGEALSFLDTSLCIEYVIPMLSVDNLEISGIEALSRFKTAKAEAAILKMLSHTSSAVVSAAIRTLELMQAVIERQYFLQMLSSANASIRHIGLEYLSKEPDKNDLPFVETLCNDLNAVVAAKAQTYCSVLDHLNEKDTVTINNEMTDVD